MAHSYYIGRSGSGKSTLLLHHAIEALESETGLIFIDPHGDAIDALLPYIPEDRNVIVFDPTHDIVSFNPLAHNADIYRTAESVLYAFRDISRYNDFGTPNFNTVMKACLLPILMTPYPTILSIVPFLTVERFRRNVLRKISDTSLLLFWDRFEALNDRAQAELISSTLNKFDELSFDARMRRTLGQKRTAFTMDDCLRGTILLARLPQGVLGVQNTRTIGMLLLAQLQVAMFDYKNSTHVFIDEAHLFQGQALMELLTGSRKFGISLHIAHQYLKQLSEPMRDALIGNTAERYVFRLSRADAHWFSEEEGPNNINSAYYELPPFTYRNDRAEELVQSLPEPDVSFDHFGLSADRYSRTTAVIDAEIQHLFDRA